MKVGPVPVEKSTTSDSRWTGLYSMTPTDTVPLPAMHVTFLPSNDTLRAWWSSILCVSVGFSPRSPL
eukprot:5773568-Prymnesium_polylepis.1